MFLLVGVKEIATLQNIDEYMMNLHSVINSNQDATLLQTVRDVVGRLEFNGWQNKNKRKKKPKK